MARNPDRRWRVTRFGVVLMALLVVLVVLGTVLGSGVLLFVADLVAERPNS